MRFVTLPSAGTATKAPLVVGESFVAAVRLMNEDARHFPYESPMGAHLAEGSVAMNPA